MFDVDAREDYIALHDEFGEILYWDEAEWEHDIDLPVTIAYLIKMGYTKGSDALREYIGAPLTPEQKAALAIEEIEED